MDEEERQNQAQKVASNIASNGKYQQKPAPQRFDPIREANSRLSAAEKASKQPDPPNYKGEAVREYQKQLTARTKAIGTHESLGTNEKMIATDREISGRMALCGYSQKEISTALDKASPYAGTLKNEKRREAYARDMANQGTAFAVKAEKNHGVASNIAQNKINEGLSHDDRRTDKLGMLQKSENNKEQKIESIKASREKHASQTTQSMLHSTYTQNQKTVKR